MKNGSKNNHQKKTTTIKQIKRMCEFSPTCVAVAKFHAVEYCLDYCRFHKELEIDAHKKAGIPLPTWEEIKHPEFAKLLPPHGSLKKRPTQLLSLVDENALVSLLVLGEFVCTGCQRSEYSNLVAIGIESYPNLEELEKFLRTQSEEFPTRHTAPHVLAGHDHPEGFFNCGDYKLVRLWKEWEKPA